MNIKRRYIGRLLAIMLAVSAFFTGAFSVTAKAAQKQEMVTTDWMGQIPGDTMLSDMSIPGTHDSGTQYVFPSYIFQCQNTSIKTQLENGYRYLDIRLELVEDEAHGSRLKFIHSFADCRSGKSLWADKLYLDDVLPYIYDFLKEHPTETIIFTVKAENGKDDISKFQEVLYQYISKNPNQWYLSNRIPSLDEARGKLVLATRFEDANEMGEMSRGLNFQWEDQGSKDIVDLPYAVSMINESQSLWVQDRYKYNIETKIEAVKDDLDNCQAAADTFSINFLSTAGTGLVGHPSKYAKAINQTFLDTSLNSHTSYGIIVVDFATKELAEHIYQSNY